MTQRGRKGSQKLNNDSFYRPPVAGAQSIIGTEKNHDSAILMKYGDDDCSQTYGQIKEAFRPFTKDDILQAYVSDNDFRSFNNGEDFGFSLKFFDIGHQTNLKSAQPIKVEHKFSENIPAVIYGYAFVLTNKLISISIDGQRHFDLI